MGKNGDILGSKTQPNFYKFAKSKKANLRLSLQSAVSSKNSEQLVSKVNDPNQMIR